MRECCKTGASIDWGKIGRYLVKVFKKKNIIDDNIIVLKRTHDI